MNRSKAREESFKLLYSLQISKDVNLDEQIKIFLQEEEIEDEDAISYIENIIKGVNENDFEEEYEEEESIGFSMSM